MQRLVLGPVVLVVLAGCSSSAQPRSAPVVAPSVVAASPAAPEGPLLFARDPPRAREPVPLSIQRILSEQRSEIHDVLVLAGPIGDARGRARAAAEVSTLADELGAIEASLRATPPDSDRLDEIVVKLQLLSTRIGILHDAIRVAAGPTSAVEVIP